MTEDEKIMGASPGFRIFLSASGQIGKTMTATRWKGCQYWIPYAKPGAQKSAKQAEVREKFKIADRAWKDSFKTAKIRDDWKRLAGQTDTPMSGYNLFMQSAFKASAINPNVEFVTTGTPSFDRILFRNVPVGPGGGPPITQKINIWMGYNQRQFTYFGSSNPSPYGFLSPTLPGKGIYYFRMSSGGIPCSGLIRIVFNP